MSEKRFLMAMRRHPSTREPLCWECSKKYKDVDQKGGGVYSDQQRLTKEEAKHWGQTCSECGKDEGPRIIEEV